MELISIFSLALVSMILISSQSTIAFAQTSPTGVDLLYKFDTSASSDVSKSMPRGITVAPNGNVYVVAQLDTAVHVFDSSGKFLFKFGSEGTGDGEFGQPIDIAIDSSNNLYVTDTHNHRIQVFDSTGKFLYKFGTFGSEDGQFHSSYYLAIDKSNIIYVADLQFGHIQVFDSSGKFLYKFGSEGTGDGEFSRYNSPQGIAIDSSGNIYAADNGNNRIQVFDSSGKFLFKFGSGIAGSGDGEFQGIYGIDVDSHNNAYVTDWNNDRIQVFDSSGKFLFDFGSADSNDDELRPLNVYVDDSDKIYVSEDLNKLSRSDKLPSSGANDYNVQVFTLDYSAPEPEPEPPTVTINIEKPTYQFGEMFYVFGTVENSVWPYRMHLHVTSDDGRDMGVAFVDTETGNYKIGFAVHKLFKPGTYTVLAVNQGEQERSHVGESASVTFEVLAVELEPEPIPEPEPSTITVNTDKSSYDKGEYIQVSGYVTNPIPGKDIGLIVVGPPPFNNIITVAQIAVASDGTWKTTLSTAGASWKYDGTYTIKVSYSHLDRIMVLIDVKIPESSGPVITPEPEVEPIPEPIQLISLYTSKSSYNEGDTIVVSGTVTSIIVGEQVSITIYLEGNLVDIAQVGVAQDGTFVHTFTTTGSQWQKSGSYTVRALYDKTTVETSFYFYNYNDQEVLGANDPVPEPEISVTTNKSYYEKDNIIGISGFIKNLNEDYDQSVVIRIVDPENSIVTIQQVNVKSDGTYSFEVIAGATWKLAGVYTIFVQYGAEKAELIIMFAGGDTTSSGGFDEEACPDCNWTEPDTGTVQPVKEEKTTICHFPPGNVDNPQTLTISENAWKAHDKHGDVFGNCPDKSEEKQFLASAEPVSPKVTPTDTPTQTSQDDDKLSEIIEENKKLREELERQGGEIKELNKQVDYLGELIASIQRIFSGWFS